MYSKTILITGSTDGLGLYTAERLARKGHFVLLHGKNTQKLQPILDKLSKTGKVDAYVADLSDIKETKSMIELIKDEHDDIDIIINNAGILNMPELQTKTKDGLDTRFVVNTISSYLIAKELLPILNPNGRIINITSAAQQPVSIPALRGEEDIDDPFDAYSQSKLGIIMHSFHMAQNMAKTTQKILALNPGSLLATKMVKDGLGITGSKEVSFGSDAVIALSLEEDFAYHTGEYFDNDRNRFAKPHPDALDPEKNTQLVQTIEEILAKY